MKAIGATPPTTAIAPDGACRNAERKVDARDLVTGSHSSLRTHAAGMRHGGTCCHHRSARRSMIPRRRSSRRDRTRAWCAMRRFSASSPPTRRRRARRPQASPHAVAHRRIRPRTKPSSTTCEEPQSARTQGSSRIAGDRTRRGSLSRRCRYTVAYIAHTPLEPRAAVAEWSGDQLTVWTGTQRPFGVRGELA